jgi:hypothetical protein
VPVSRDAQRSAWREANTSGLRLDARHALRCASRLTEELHGNDSEHPMTHPWHDVIPGKNLPAESAASEASCGRVDLAGCAQRPYNQGVESFPVDGVA